MSEAVIGTDLGSYTPSDGGFTITLNDIGYDVKLEEILHIENMTQGVFYYKLAERVYCGGKKISISNNIISISNEGEFNAIQSTDKIRIKIKSPLNVQNPLPTNGDSIYIKDIDWDNSDFTDWTGDLTEIFKSPFSTSITNITSDNPKQIIVAFKRTINAIQIGFGENNGGNFSNTKVSLLGSAGASRSVYDDSSNNTKKNSLNAQIGDELFNSIKIEFFTADAVSLSNLTIQRSNYVVNGNSVLNPSPTSTDSVYAKDLDLSRTIITGWVGNVTDLYGDLTRGLTYTGAASPKIITMYFQRTIVTNSMGLGANTGNFSNTKITALLSGGGVYVLYDGSTDSTIRTSQTIQFTPLGFVGLQIEFYTTNDVTLTNVVIIKTISTVSRLQATSELTGLVENINSFRGALNVTNSLVHKIGINLFFFRETGISTIIANIASVDDTSIVVVSAAGFAIGNKIKVTSSISSGQSFIKITNIVANTITLDRPLSVGLAIGDDVDVVNTSLNANGSLASPVIYKIIPPNGTLNAIWQLTRMLINITDGSPMDDGLFGSISALTNGLNLRIVKGDGSIQDITNWKTNGEIALDMYDTTYTDKAPSGEYGLRGRWTFTNAQFIVELEGSEGDYFELLVQDDLTALTNFEIKCQGRLFGG